MADATIRVIVDPTGAVRGTRVVNKALGSTTKEAKTTSSALTGLRQAAAALGLALSVRELINYADAFTQIQNRILVAGVATESLANATERLRKISFDTRTDLEGNVQLFQRLGIAQQQLGATSEELFQFVENVGRGLAIQGAAAGTARGAVLQLSQAVGSSIVRAEEFNSILEGAFPIALAAAKGIERTGGSVAKLRSEIISGTVTSKEFFQALLSQTDALEEQFGRTTPTVSQAFTVLNNEITVFIGSLDTAEGFTASLARGMISLALNLDTAAKALGVVLAFLAPAILAGIASGFASMAVAATAFFVALGPLGIALSIFSAAAAAAFLFGDSLQPIPGSIADVRDIAEATFSVLREDVEGLIDLIDVSFNAALDSATQGFVANGQIISGVFDFLTSVVRTFINIVINSFRILLESLGSVGAAMVQIATGDITSAAQTVKDAFAKAFDIAGQDSVQILVDSGTRVLDAFAPRIIAEAERRAKARQQSTSGGTASTGVTIGGGATLDESFSLTDKQATAFGKLKDQLEPLVALQRKFTEAETLLNEAQRAGLVTSEQKAVLLGKLNEAYEDGLNPLKAVNDQLSRETELLGLSVDEREVEIELRKVSNDLKEQGVILSDAEEEALRSSLTQLQSLNEEKDREFNLLQAIKAPSQDAIANLKTLNKLRAEGTITLEEFTEASQAQRLALLDESSTFADGVERGLIRANESIGDFADEAERGIARAFGGAEDVIADFVTGTKIDIGSLVDSILADLLRMSIRQAVLAPLAQAFQTGSTPGAPAGGGGAFGAGLSALASFGDGGIQNSPTISNLAENGPEAIIPLKGGNVPVKINGGGGQTIVNNFNIKTQDAQSFKNSQNQVLRDFGQSVQRIQVRNG